MAELNVFPDPGGGAVGDGDLHPARVGIDEELPVGVGRDGIGGA